MRLTGREIVVPASIGNLGPGFDTLGLAVSLYLRARITRVVDDGRGRLACRFVGGQPLGSNRIGRAFRALRRRRRRFPSLEVEVRSGIPQRAGLGSSAAATIAGLRLRELVDGRRPLEEVIAAANRLEGHPDNSVAALFGGMTSSCVTGDGGVVVTRWRWPRAWRIVVATPAVELSTAISRRALPRKVPLAAAVFNFQRLALLLAAVNGRSPAALREALRDRCHQPYRRRLVPLLQQVLELKHPDLLGLCLSGGGPSVVAFAARNVSGVASALRRVYRGASVPCTIRVLAVHEGKS